MTNRHINLAQEQTLSAIDIANIISSQIYDGEVLTFADLPDPTTVSGQTYLVETTTNRLNPFTATRFSGLYRSDGTEWKFTGVDIAAVQALIDNHATRTDNPHAVTKAQVGLANVDNTSDLDKPISTATQAALDAISVESWEYFAANWDTPPTLNKSITGGDVYNYTLNSVTRFRFVPSTYDATQDTFYENFNDTTDILSNPIVSRGV